MNYPDVPRKAAFVSKEVMHNYLEEMSGKRIVIDDELMDFKITLP